MKMFESEEEMLIELDNFLYKSKLLGSNPLRVSLVQHINDFLYEHELHPYEHDFVKHNKKYDRA